MKRLLYLMAFVILISTAAVAVNITLSTNRTEDIISPEVKEVHIGENESIRLDLKVVEPGHMGGAFTISREVAENTYKMVGVPHFVVASCSCRGTAESTDINDYMIFNPPLQGKYRIEATYGGATKRIDLYVGVGNADNESGSTSSIPTTTSSTSASRTTSTAAFLPLETTTTTTFPFLEQSSPAPTKSLPEKTTVYNIGGCGCQKNYLLLAAVPLAVLLICLGGRFHLIGK